MARPTLKTLRQGGIFDAFLLILVVMGVLFSLFIPLFRIIYHVNSIELNAYAEVSTLYIRWEEVPEPLKEDLRHNLCELLNQAGENYSLDGRILITGTIILLGSHYTSPTIILENKYGGTEESNYLYLNRLYGSERARYSYTIEAFCQRLKPIQYGVIVPVLFRVYYNGVEAPGVARYYSTSEHLNTYDLKPVKMYLDRYLIGGVLFYDRGFEAMAASFAILVFILLIIASLVKTRKFSFNLLAYAYLLITIVLIIITAIDYYTLNYIIVSENRYPSLDLYNAKITIHFLFSDPDNALRIIGARVNYVESTLGKASLERVSANVEGGVEATGLGLRLILLAISISATILYSKISRLYRRS